ncbi:MAG: hypothetical protein E3J35_02450 [Methanomassiliicoccales archaeon]|nr:MAG: hypothetical protein E3J35_02450 [Methanomassiliicoccales archaeon]
MKANRAALTVSVLVLLSTFHLVLSFMPENVRATTLYVGGVGPGNYTSIQDAIDDASPGDTIFVYNGTYREHVGVYKPLSLIGEHRNTTIIDGDGWGDVVYVISDWVNVTGFTVTNGGFSGSDSGIELFQVQKCSVSNNRALATDLWGIYLYNSHNNIVANNTVSDNWYGITLWASRGNIVTNNNASNNFDDGIRLYSSDGNVIENNTVLNNSAVGISLSSSDVNVVTGNTVRDNGEFGIFLGSSRSAVITGNLMENDGIFIDGGFLERWNTHTIDTSNTVNGKPVYYWRNVTGGKVPSNAGEVILANCTNVVVESQDFHNGSVGIELGFSSNNSITNITARNNVYGIYLSHSLDNTILNITAWNNTYGTSLFWAGNNTVVSNNFSYNEYGIHLYRSYSNIITDNTASSNIEYGAHLSFSDFNRIYHNCFTDNARQAYDEAQTNQWDDGYPSGGNYWNNYSGIDEKSGPRQDFPGSDGIGDEPFIIGSDSRDRYPLMTPLGIGLPRPPWILHSLLSGKDRENVTLVWALSSDDRVGFGNVMGYRIYRNTTYDSFGLGYGLIASLPRRTSEHVDTSAGEGDPNNHFYEICVVDVNNNTSCATNQAAKFTRPLPGGPNLVSIPLVQTNESIQIVLQTLSFGNAWAYDPINQEWESLMKSKPYGGKLERVNHTMGIWVNVTKDSNLTVAGVVPTQTLIDLSEGWNLVGYPSFNLTFTVSDLKAGIAATRVEGFDIISSPYHLRKLNDVDTLQAGYGYWVGVEVDTVWTVEAA